MLSNKEQKQMDGLKAENEKYRTALHNVINQACYGANYHNALFNIIETVANALPDYEVYREHGVLTPKK